MIKVEVVEPTTPEWLDWRRRCKKETDLLIANWRPGLKCIFKARLYSEMKAVMMGFFHNKCAYCETKITTAQYGDVEHFRPKGKVADDDNRPVMFKAADDKEYPHPGYFWLAYDWTNLLPSCVLCNQPSKKIGKWNRFPVRFKNVIWPDDFLTEQPLLINPMIEDPSPHFEFDSSTGRLIGITDVGKKCNEVFGLNEEREGLMEARRGVYSAVLLQSNRAQDAVLNNAIDDVKYSLETILQHKRGEAEYSIAGRKALAREKAKLLAYLSLI